MAVSLSVSLQFSLKGEASPEMSATTELAVAIPASSLPVRHTAWPGSATQSLSMVVVGSLLIGLGSVVRRSV
jgi:hypothetical protein